MRRYDYFKDLGLLHTNVNAGHFTQMVWIKTKYFGVGKATSATGKIFVVAYYYPIGKYYCPLSSDSIVLIKMFINFVVEKKNKKKTGNVVNEFHENVLPPTMEQSSGSPKPGEGNLLSNTK